jgi:20S proteasome subunit alpha 4
MRAVQKGATAVSVCTDDVVVIGVEKKSSQKLQQSHTVRKILQVDSHICLTFAGLSADARVLVNKARFECQSHRLTVEDPPTVEYVARFIAQTQQEYTQRGGRRPFGIATLICGFDPNGRPALWQTDPSGTYAQWKANAIGTNDQALKEYLEKEYDELKDSKLTEQQAIELVTKALLENVEAGSKNLEIAVLRRGEELDFLASDVITQIELAVEAEKDAKKK